MSVKIASPGIDRAIVEIILAGNLQQQESPRCTDEMVKRSHARAVIEVVQCALTDDEVVASGRPPCRDVVVLVSKLLRSVGADIDARVPNLGVRSSKVTTPPSRPGSNIEHRTNGDSPPFRQSKGRIGEMSYARRCLDRTASVPASVIRRIEALGHCPCKRILSQRRFSQHRSSRHVRTRHVPTLHRVAYPSNHSSASARSRQTRPVLRFRSP